MRADIKFCGLTRADDAAEASRLGARYAGVIFAGGPRLLTPVQAAAVLEGVGEGTRRVGVFGADASASTIAEVARVAALDAVQLHGDPEPGTVDEVRRSFGGEVWAVVRVAGTELPARAGTLFEAADAVVLDALVAGAQGGTGVTLEWSALADAVANARGGGRLVLAGGLRPENVARAIEALAPDVVDVSSGVETRPGVKDHARMRAFRDAVDNAGRTG